MKRIIFGLLILTFFGTIAVFAQETALISVSTDGSTYDEGDIIVVSGKVTTVIIGTPVTMQLFNQGNLIDIAQIDVAQDGTFSSTIVAKGPLWTNTGDYTIRVLFGEGNMAETTFKFFPAKSGPAETQLFEVDAGSYGTFDVEYSIVGGIVKDIKIEPNNFALVVTIESSEKGSILLKIPRDSLDAKKQDESDEEFIVLIDEIPVKYEESSTESSSRIITINFDKGDSIIKIIGTTIIPEFGAVAMMILVIGFITIIITKNKLYARF